MLTAIFLVGIAVVVWTLIQAYRRRRIAYGRGFFKLLYADLDRQPALFWFAVAMYVVVGLTLDWQLVGVPHRPT